MLIPCPLDFSPARFNDLSQLLHNPGVETMIISESDLRIKPELAVGITPLDVDMHRLTRIALVGIEVKAVTFPAEDLGHG